MPVIIVKVAIIQSIMKKVTGIFPEINRNLSYCLDRLCMAIFFEDNLETK